MDSEHVQSTTDHLEISTMDTTYQIESRLMQLPVDIISLFQAHLSPASKIAFSLACRGLYERYFASARKARASASDSEKRDTIFLLEKDVSHREFFCPFCRCFRRFGPGCKEGLCSFERYHNLDPEDSGSRRLAISDNQGPEITFPLGRLVMNRHFFGEDRGLPLSCLEVTDLPVKAWGEGKNALTWKETRRARIIGDELYLRCTHVLDQAEQQDMDSWDLRDSLRGRSFYGFCKHQATGRVIRNPVFVGHRKMRYAIGDSKWFTAHKELGFGCPKCLTDCTTSVEWRPRLEVGADGTACEDARKRGGWVFRVDTYRQLGSFRQAGDPRFMLACTSSLEHTRRQLVDSEWTKIDGKNFRFGSIWRRWHGPEAPQAPLGGWLPGGYIGTYLNTG